VKKAAQVIIIIYKYMKVWKSLSMIICMDLYGMNLVVMNDFIIGNEIAWSECEDVSIDGASAILGKYK
jgi:hypothetical protein